MATNTPQQDTNVKVSLISKIAYGFGDVGCNFSWMFVSNFLMIFYTDVCGIPMAAVSLLMLISRFWDAINDPLIGSLSDRTNTRWGRYRPWLLIGAPLTAIVLVLTFWAHPDWSDGSKTVYMYITYCLLVFGYTCVNIPYGTLCGALTQNIEERAQINTSRSVCAMIAINIINIVTLPLIAAFGGENQARGYILVTVLYGVIFTACHWFCFAKTREIVAPTEKKSIPIGVQLRAAIQNKPYLIALIGQLLFGLVHYGRSANLMYYFKYVEGDEGLFTTYSMVLMLPSIIGAAAFPFVFRWLGNKGRTASLFAAATGVCVLALYFFSPVTSPIPFYACSALSQLFFCGFNTAIYAIVPDCVEYGEWKTGIRNDGFQYAFVSLGNKVGMAVGTAALAAVLNQLDFKANQVQNLAVQGVIHHAFSTIPGVLWIVTAISFDPNYRPLLWYGEIPAKEQMLKAVAMCDILKVSEEEMLLLTGESDLNKASQTLLEMGPALVLVSLGPKGSYHRNHVCTGQMPTYDVKTIDTTGAGDAFVGAILWQLRNRSRVEIERMSDKELGSIVDFANAAGSLTTTKSGAIPAIPTMEQIKDCQNGKEV